MAENIIRNPVERIANTLSKEKVTESDPRGIELMINTALANMYGDIKIVVGAKEHPIVMYSLLVGETSTGRKGETISVAKKVLADIDPVWLEDNVISGLRTGPGLMEELSNEKNEIVKRLVIEEEAAPIFKDSRMREGILSELLRQAYDLSPLRIMTVVQRSVKNYKLDVFGAITPVELSSLASDESKKNGLINRFSILLVGKVQSLPFPVSYKKSLFSAEIDQLKESLVFAQQIKHVGMSDAAKSVWEKYYLELDKDQEDQYLGPLTARAATQILRVAGINALTEKSRVIEPHHLDKSYEFWQHCKFSADEIFCSRKSDKNLHKLLSALEISKDGLTLGQIRNEVFSRNKSQKETAYYLGILETRGLAKKEKIRTKGRPVILWSALPKQEGKN